MLFALCCVHPPEHGGAPALAAIDALGRVFEIGERLLEIAERLGPIRPAQLRRYNRAVVTTIVNFVPACHHDEASQPAILSRVIWR